MLPTFHQKEKQFSTNCYQMSRTENHRLTHLNVEWTQHIDVQEPFNWLMRKVPGHQTTLDLKCGKSPTLDWDQWSIHLMSGHRFVTDDSGCRPHTNGLLMVVVWLSRGKTKCKLALQGLACGAYKFSTALGEMECRKKICLLSSPLLSN